MKKVVVTEIFQVTEPSKIWTVPVTQGKVFYELEALYDENKKILDVPHTVSEEFDNLIIDFGFDTHRGYVKYSWIEYSDGDDTPSTQSPVTVNVTNNDGCCDTPASPQMLTKSFSEPIDIKVAELSADCVTIDYCLKSVDGIEAGRLTIIDDTTLKLDAERFVNNDLLDISFSANKNDDVINLHVGDVIKEYEIKYKLTIF